MLRYTCSLWSPTPLENSFNSTLMLPFKWCYSMHLWNQATLSYLCCFPLCPCCQHHSLSICNNSVLTDCRDLACWKERLGWTSLSELGLERERDQPCKFLQTGMTVCPSTRGDTEAGKHKGHRHLGATQCKEHVKCIWQRSENKRLDHSYILFLTMWVFTLLTYY